jgi:mannose/fructose/N-acetylgalactosamine-specific phosphotransferase system component IIC
MFAYLKVPLVGIALFGLPIAIMFVLFADRGTAAGTAAEAPATSPATSPTADQEVTA